MAILQGTFTVPFFAPGTGIFFVDDENVTPDGFQQVIPLVDPDGDGPLNAIEFTIAGTTFTEDSTLAAPTAVFNSGELAGITFSPSPLLPPPLPAPFTSININQTLATATTSFGPQEATVSYGPLVEPPPPPVPFVSAFTVEGGLLDGEQGSLKFDFDQSQIPPEGATASVNIPLTLFEFTLAGETLTLADDADGANVQYEGNEFNGFDFATTSVPATSSFFSVSFEVGANGPNFGSFALLDNDFTLVNVGFAEPVPMSMNTEPVSVGDSFTTDEDITLSDTVAANDSDPEGDALTFSVTSDVSNGELVFNADGSFDYTPAADFNGADSFTYEVTDSEFTATATADITINPVNDAPVAQDDVDGTSENTATTIDVLANDSDVDGDALTVTAGAAGNGTTDVNADGTVTYTPDADFSGTDSFTYEVSDGELTDTATVTVNVSDVNGAPDAVDDSFTLDEDTVLSDTVASNDVDPDGDVLTFSLGDTAANGTVDFNADGTFSYTPAADFFGTDSFTYTVSDGELTDTATVNIEVFDVVDTNIVTDSFEFLIPGGDLAGEVGNVDITFDAALVDDSIAGLQNIPLESIEFNLAGETLTLADDTDGANVQFENGEFNGTDFATTAVPATDSFISVSFEVGADGLDIGSFALVDNNFQVTDVELGLINLAPVAVDDSFTVDEDTILTGDVAGNDSDLNGDDLIFALATEGANGTVDFNADGTFSYTPNADFFGTDSFTYTVSDGELTDTATVDITVNDVPDEDLVTVDFDFIVPVGALVGEVGDVSITYDVSLIDDSIQGLQNIPLEVITFNLAGETLTLADDADGANAQLEDGAFNGTDFAVTTIPVNDTFISVSFEVGADGPDIGSFALVDNNFQVIDVDIFDEAEFITETFDFTVPDGALAGETGSVSIAYDALLIDDSIAGLQNIPLAAIEFTLAGETLTLADDADGGNVQFEDGEFNGTDFAVTTIPVNDTFISVSFEVGANGPDIGSFALVDNDFQVIDVELVDELVASFQVELIDADTDETLTTIEDGSVIDADLVSGRNLTLSAFVPETSPLFGEVSSVFLDFNNGDETRRENGEPYSLFGDFQGDFFRGDFDLLQENTLTLTAFEGRNLQGEQLDEVTFNFSIDGNFEPPLPVSVGLFDADTDTLIAPLRDGAEIGVEAGQNLTVGVFVDENDELFDQVHSVRLDLNNGDIVRSENVEPYALFGDNRGDFNGGSIPLGDNTLDLDIFSRNNLRGNQLADLTVDFTLVEVA